MQEIVDGAGARLLHLNNRVINSLKMCVFWKRFPLLMIHSFCVIVSLRLQNISKYSAANGGKTHIKGVSISSFHLHWNFSCFPMACTMHFFTLDRSLYVMSQSMLGLLSLYFVNHVSISVKYIYRKISIAFTHFVELIFLIPNIFFVVLLLILMF